MKTITKITYDPSAQRLVYIRDGKNIGGLQGAVAERQYLTLLESDSEINIVIMSTKSKLVRQLRAIWLSQGIDDQREAILTTYGVASTSELNESELKELIDHFSMEVDSKEDIRKNRSIVIMLLQRIGVYNNDGDWKKVNRYLLDKRIAGKLMYQMDVKELKTLALKLRGIEQKENSAALKAKLN